MEENKTPTPAPEEEALRIAEELLATYRAAFLELVK